ncbi:hypothetical protein MHYP_G00029400 [Metynnis hypsauchen]
MPDIELLKRPSKEGGDSLQDQGELQKVYSCSHSCELTNVPASCVKKAVCHIQELKNKLENWCQQGIYNQHDHSQGKNQNGNIWRVHSVDSKIPVTPNELCIEGMGLCLQSNYDHFWKGLDGVLLEVMSLMERLESDRQEAKEALQKEKLKGQTLRRKQDNLCLWKQQQFPAAVQIEYEACIRDINELKWHLKVKKDQMQQVRNSLSHTEVQNRWLVEDIDFVKKHGPLVKEKLQLESEIMKQIKSAQAESREMFSKLSHELSKSKQELESEELLANKERGLITMELKDSQSQLKGQLTNLQQLKSYWDCYCTKVRETEEKVALNSNQLDTVLLQIPFLEAQETKINYIVMELRAKMEDQNREVHEKQSGTVHLQKQIQTTRQEGEPKLFEVEEVFNKKRRELLHLYGENKVHEMESEDYNKRIYQSKQAVKQLQRDRKRILEKISQNEEEREQVKGELTLEAAQHTNTKARLEDLEEQIFMWEQRMSRETEKLKMQLMSEMKVVATLKSTISSIMEEHNLVKVDYERAKNELLKEYEDVSSTTSLLEAEVVELKEIHTVKSEKIVKLEWKLSDILTERERLCGDLEKKKSTCLEHLNSITKAHSAVSVKCEQTSCRIEEHRLKSEECRKASDMMEHIATTMPQVIEELQSMSDMEEYKHNSAAIVMNSLQSDITACRSRTGLSEKAHSILLAQRQAVMLDSKANLKKALKENVELAQEYKASQQALLIARQEAVCVFNKKNKTKESFHDYKQLSLLQRRMHKAMLKYFKHRSVYSQAELASFQALSNQNNQKMKALQEEFSRAICRISAFLYLLTDDSTTGHDAAVAATADEQRRMDNDGLYMAMPTVQIAE